MKKRFLLFLLSFSMLISMLIYIPFAVSAADDEAFNTSTGQLTSFANAVASARDGDKIMLYKDVTASSTVTIGKSITVDGGGHTYTYTSTTDSRAFDITANVTFKNMTVNALGAGGFGVSGGSLTLGEKDKPTSSVTVNASGTNEGRTAVFVCGSQKAVVNLNYASLSAGKMLICMASPQYELNIYDGTYTILAGTVGGRLIQASNDYTTTLKQINIYSGDFFADYGYAFNFSNSGIVANIYGGNFNISGDTSKLFIAKSNAVLNIYGGIFNAPQMVEPISIGSNNGSGTVINAYGGTVICSGTQPISVPAGDYTANIYGITTINSTSLCNIDITNVKPYIVTGAAVNLNSYAPGMRFSAVLPKYALDILNTKKDTGTELAYGVLVVRTDKLEGLPFCNYDAINELDLISGTDYYDLAAAEVATGEGGDISFAAELMGISESDFATDFSAVPYVKLRIGGKDVLVYANYSDANTRNMKDIAVRALADHDEHNIYNSTQIATLERYASATYNDGDAYVSRVLSLNVLTQEPKLYNATSNANGYKFYLGQGESDYTFEKRLAYIRATVEYADPDVMLFQEYSGISYWGQAITLNNTDSTGFYYTSPQFPGYTWVNHGNRRNVLYKDNTDAYMSSLGYGKNPFHAHNFVIYDNEKFDYVASGTRFVSKTGTRPDSVGSEDIKNLLFNNASGGQGLYDDLGDFTWVVLREKATGLCAIYASIHTYNNGVPARYAYYLDNLQCALSFLQSKSEEYGDIPVIIGGDFNMTVRGGHMREHYEHITNVANYKDAKVTGSDYGTVRDFGGSSVVTPASSHYGDKVDYIFANGADTYGYEVLKGQIVNGEYDHYANVGTQGLATDGYDVSDHLAIMTDVIVRRGQTYIKENEADYYSNPNTKNDTVISANGGAVNATNIKFNNSTVLRDVHNAEEKHGSQYIDWKLVSDNGTAALRIAATDETNYVNTVLADPTVLGNTGISGKTITVRYKTELTFIADLSFVVTSSSGAQYTAKLQVSGGNVDWRYNMANGVWKTATITVPSGASGNITDIKLFGRTSSTGLLCGDAVYIDSITIG